jgi:UDP-N-acetylmuramyl pentapeptide synthase
LTGSNGKTTTKELISNVLAEKFKVQYTFGNLNNHIGVPLTLLSIRSEHEIAVIEMGANHQKEIDFFVKSQSQTSVILPILVKLILKVLADLKVLSKVSPNFITISKKIDRRSG